MTVETSYARFSDATNSATSIKATRFQLALLGTSPKECSLLSLGKVLVNGAPPALSRICIISWARDAVTHL